MRKQSGTFKSGALPRLSMVTFIAGLLPALVLLFSLRPAYAGSATWNLSPTSNDWLTAANWTPATVPNAPSDTSTFGISNTTDVTFSGNVTVSTVVFAAGASAYTIDAGAYTFFVEGPAPQNNSANPQNIIGTGFILFSFGAGNDISYTYTGGKIEFDQAATAGNCDLTIAGGGTIDFELQSTAGTSTLTANGGSVILFTLRTTADSSTVVLDDGGLYFSSFSHGGTARVEVLGTSTMDISGSLTVGITTGSIEGSGSVFLGSKSLTVGGDNLSTAFSGIIQDGGTSGGSGGSLTKTGKGILNLTNANTYTGGTTVTKGTLLVGNRTGSATGSGAVQVSGGTLGGTGHITGTVHVGLTTTAGTLAPGSGNKPGTLTVTNALTFDSLATYKADLNASVRAADRVVAAGVTINSGAKVTLDDLRTVALPSGTVFTLISNTAATPIFGVFSNLADGATVTVGSNIYQASYEGGDGNDLTLTVLP